MTMGPVDLVIFQGTPFCNIDCNYCYLPERLDKTRISLSVIDKTIDRLLEADLIHGGMTIGWHAGEPLVLPISFYREAIALIRRKIPENVKVVHNIQTNLTLLTQEWCDFIKENNVDLGISLDGPEFLHDRNRVHRNGKGTFHLVMKGIELMKKNNMPLRAIAVLTKESAMYPIEMFHFFHELGVEWVGFNIDEIESDNTTSSYTDNSDAEDIVSNFYNTFLDLQRTAGKSFFVRELRNAQLKIKYSPIDNLNSSQLDLGQLLSPFQLLTVGVKGDFSTFCPEMLHAASTNPYGSLALGNVFEHSIEDVCKSEKFRRVYTDIMKGVYMCR